MPRIRVDTASAGPDWLDEESSWTTRTSTFTSRTTGTPTVSGATHSPCGEPAAPQDFAIPFSDKDLKLLVLTMSRKRSRRIDSQELEDARTIGGELPSSVFGDDIGSVYQRSRDQCRESGKGLRLRLNLTETPALLNIPWELFYDESHKPNFLSLMGDTPPVRYLSLKDSPVPLRGKLPLRILVMVSNPIDVNELDVEMETDKLRQALAPLEIDRQIALDVILQPCRPFKKAWPTRSTTSSTSSVTVVLIRRAR